MPWRDYFFSHIRELIAIIKENPMKQEPDEFKRPDHPPPLDTGKKKTDREQAGTFVGYEVEYQDFEDGAPKWKKVPIKHQYLAKGARVDGTPFPLLFGGILETIWLCGESQALALGYGYAADADAVQGFAPNIRLVPYEIKYSISATKKEPKE